MTALGRRSVRGGLGLDRGGAPARGALAVWVGAWLLLAAAAAAADATLKVRVQDGQTLREIARQYLGDPDLWTEILRANSLSSITDVHPGLELVIPAAPIVKADRALRDALAAIQQATEQGARLFAAEQIGNGLRLYEGAVTARKGGDWAQAGRLADEARVAAGEALKTALARRDTAAEALLSDREGSVEGRKPQELVWADRERGALLVEEEALRTLSSSSAQVTFRDDSRLRLGANSQALIRRMRVDPLSRREEAKVSLVEGDLYALLDGRSERKRFELDVPGVRTEVASRDFWVRHDESGSKFANYDDRALSVAANGGQVTLGRDEGTLVREGRPPSGKVGVLPAPALSAPPDDGRTFGADAELRWSAVPDAVGYWLEIARDAGYERMAASRWGLKEASFPTGPLEVGTYYWRVTALDKFGLPGARSAAWRFTVRTDRVPPYLTIREPAEGGIIRASPVLVRGEVEKGATLRLAGVSLEVAADGTFTTEVDARPGENEVALEAVDAAGNITDRKRSFLYAPDERAVLRFDDGIPQLSPRRFVTARDVISLTGVTDPGARLLVRAAADGTQRATTYADDSGRFTLNVPMTGSAEEFVAEVVQRSGFASEDRFSVAQDREPPAITLESPQPALTATEWLPLRGSIPGAKSLSVNGRPVPLAGNGMFDETLTLRPGRNPIELIATDLVGNVGVARFEVTLDQDPPELVGFTLTPRELKGGEPLRIELTARDASGLRKAAPFKVRVGQAEYADFLELGGGGTTNGTYRKTVQPPPGLAGRVTLREVELEDYAGNKARLTPER